MSRPAQTIPNETVEDIAFRVAIGETVRSISKATGLSEYYVKKIIKHPGFTILLDHKRREIAALNGGAA